MRGARDAEEANENGRGTIRMKSASLDAFEYRESLSELAQHPSAARRIDARGERNGDVRMIPVSELRD